MASVELPVPPSVNNIWRSIRTRKGVKVVCSRTYKTWQAEAILRLRMGMGVVAVRDYPVCVTVVIHRGRGWKRTDPDNLLKALIDALKKAQRIKDDNEDYVTRCVVEFGEKRPDACVAVTVTPMTAAGAAA